MANLTYKELTRRRRPHFQPLEAKLFVTFRLVDSVPKAIGQHYKANRRWVRDQLRRAQLSDAADRSTASGNWLARVEELDREWFIKCETILHRHLIGPHWMRDDSIAAKVAENLHRLNGDAYRLDAFSIMSNHVHTVFKPLVSAAVMEQILRAPDCVDRVPALSKIMQAIKGRSARECNLILGRTGSFWEHESFDRVVRAGKFDTTVRYVLQNPVKAGIVEHWEDYRWNFCRKELVRRFR